MSDETQAATSTAQNDGKDQQQATTAAKPETKTLTQAEIDAIVEARLNRDREVREEKLSKELGMSIKEAKALIKARQDAQEAEKTALEKANERAAELEKALNERNLRDLKRTLVDGMIASKQIKLPDGVSISDVLDMVNGADEDGIKASAGKLTKFFPFNASMGSGSNPANGSQREATLDEQIKAAQEVGFKTGDWSLYNKLTLKKTKG